jgi:hypothetical protein
MLRPATLEMEMPNCYRLISKVDGQVADFIAVDEAMCKHFGVEPHPKFWYWNWENVEGLACALGKDWDWQRANMPERKEIIDFLEANYTVDAWAEIGRR